MTGPGPGAGGVERAGDSGGAVRPARVPAQSTILASELGGDLPCLRCKYNLKGLSIRTVCPECATPVRATLLAIVDPMASELRAIPRPALTGLGVVTWSTAALGAAACVWLMRVLEAWTADPLIHRIMDALGVGVVCLTVISGAGALVLIKPHDGIRTRDRRLALLSTLAYVPLALVMWWLHVDMGSEGFGLGGWGGGGGLHDSMGAARSELRILADIIMIVIIVGLRPNARLLAARSLLMRTGRVDRQTMLALVGVLGLSIAGDAAALAASMIPGPFGQTLHLVGLVVVMVASILFTIGLVGVVVDCWRMRPVIIDAPVSLDRILAVDAMVPSAHDASGPRPQTSPPT